MPVKIEMDMPENCTNCRYCSRGHGVDRIVCRLTQHDFATAEGRYSTFVTCPLKKCK